MFVPSVLHDLFHLSTLAFHVCLRFIRHFLRRLFPRVQLPPERLEIPHPADVLRQIRRDRNRVLNRYFLRLQHQNRLQLALHPLEHRRLRVLRVRLLRLESVDAVLLEPVLVEQRNLLLHTDLHQQLLDQHQGIPRP